MLTLLLTRGLLKGGKQLFGWGPFAQVVVYVCFLTIHREGTRGGTSSLALNGRMGCWRMCLTQLPKHRVIIGFEHRVVRLQAAMLCQ